MRKSHREMAWRQLNLNRLLSPSYVLKGKPRLIRCETSIVLLNLEANKFYTDVVYNKNQYSRIHRMWQVTTEPKKTKVIQNELLDDSVKRHLFTDYCLPVLDISFLDYPFQHLRMNWDRSQIVRFRPEENLDNIKAELDAIEKNFNYKCIESPLGFMINENHFIFFKNEGWFDFSSQDED